LVSGRKRRGYAAWLGVYFSAILRDTVGPVGVAEMWQGNAKRLSQKLRGVAYNSSDERVSPRTLSIWLERTDARVGLYGIYFYG
jgi:hypothetical protein